jgi:O-antigen/teichoic acid export membrane protein
LLGAARPAAEYYRRPEVFHVLCALAFGPLFASLENIGVVRFRKELQFRKEFTFRASRRLLAFSVTLPLAFVMRSYRALVGGILMTKLGSSVLSYVAHEFRPRFCLTQAKELFSFSGWLLLNNMVIFFKERSTDFVVGRLLGPASLGVYSISYETANMPTVEVSAAINRALLPGFARIAAGMTCVSPTGTRWGFSRCWHCLPPPASMQSHHLWCRLYWGRSGWRAPP